MVDDRANTKGEKKINNGFHVRRPPNGAHCNLWLAEYSHVKTEPQRNQAHSLTHTHTPAKKNIWVNRDREKENRKLLQTRVNYRITWSRVEYNNNDIAGAWRHECPLISKWHTWTLTVVWRDAGKERDFVSFTFFYKIENFENTFSIRTDIVLHVRCALHPCSTWRIVSSSNPFV